MYEKYRRENIYLLDKILTIFSSTTHYQTQLYLRELKQSCELSDASLVNYNWDLRKFEYNSTHNFLNSDKLPENYKELIYLLNAYLSPLRRLIEGDITSQETIDELKMYLVQRLRNLASYLQTLTSYQDSTMCLIANGYSYEEALLLNASVHDM